MKTIQMMADGWYMKMFMFLTGRTYKDLPDNTCNVFWESVRMVAVFPLTFLGSVFFKLVDDDKKRLWGRFGASALIVVIYVVLLLLGDIMWVTWVLGLESGPGVNAFPGMNWAGAFLLLPFVGAITLGIPVAFIFVFLIGIFKSIDVYQDNYQDSINKRFKAKLDPETGLPENKFLLVLHSMHEKTCTKIDWRAK